MTPRRMIKIVCDLTTVKCTKDARSLLQKFALPATKLRRNVIAPNAGCCNSLLLKDKPHPHEDIFCDTLFLLEFPTYSKGL